LSVPHKNTDKNVCVTLKFYLISPSRFEKVCKGRFVFWEIQDFVKKSIVEFA